MNILRKILNSLSRNRCDADMQEELRLHLEERARQNREDGMPAEEALNAARRRFGGVAQIQEQCREQRRSLALEQIFQDLRQAVRSLSKTPGFTAIAILTLALGIGLNTSMFSLANALILRPLPFPEPGELVALFKNSGRFDHGGFSRTDVTHLKQAEGNIARFAAYAYSAVSMSEPGRPAEWQNTLRVSPDFFDILGLKPGLGRAFRPDEDVSGNDKVAVVSHTLWQTQFAGASDVLGREIRLDGETYQIVGVLPETAYDRRLFGNAQIFRPLVFTNAEQARQDVAFLDVLGRKQPGVGKAELDAFVSSIGATSPADFSKQNGQGQTIWRTTSLLESTSNPNVPKLLALLIGLSTSVLLVACSNLANFALARVIARTHESAVRAALGASRMRLLRPLVLEAVLLAAAGSAAALLVMHGTASWLARELAKAGESLGGLSLDWRVLSFTFTTSLVTILVFGIGAALVTSRINPNAALKSGAQGATMGRGHYRLGRFLIVVQFLFATTLVSSAGFFIRSAHHLLDRHPGWETDRVVQGRLQLPSSRYRNDRSALAFQQRALEQLQGVRGVEYASLSYGLPYHGLHGSRRYVAETVTTAKNGTSPEVRVAANAISNDYFKTTGTRLLRGRAFGTQDSATSPRVAIVSESFVRALIGDRDPIGLRICQAGTATPDWVEIVGVVEDVHSPNFADSGVRAQIYEPIMQDVWYNGDGKIAGLFVAVRMVPGVKPIAAQDAVRAAIMAIDQDLPLRDLTPASTVVNRVTGSFTLLKRLLTTFAVLGLFLAAIGLAGLAVREVNQRAREIGLRMALGAQMRDILRQLVGGGVRTASIGVASGLLLGFVAGRLITSVFPSLQTDEVLVCAISATILMLTAFVACYLPARRAAKVSPMSALRSL